QLAIVARDGGRLIGDLGLRVDGEEPTTAELGYTLAPAFHGHGYATEAAAALCRWALATLDVARVVATTDAQNLASIRVLARLGMQRIEERATKFRGRPCVELTYELSRPSARQ